jgi:hypothetical protein
MRDENSNLELKFLDYRTDPEIAASLDVSNNGIVFFRSENLNKSLTASSYLDAKVTVRSIEDLKKMEQKFIRAIVKVNSPEKTIYFSQTHGEFDLVSSADSSDSTLKNETFRRVKEDLRNANITLKQWNLETGYPKKVPDDTDLLAIISPENEFSSVAIRSIKKYLKRGGRLLVSLNGSKNVTLKKLLNGMQIEFKNEVVYSKTTVPDLVGDIHYDHDHPVGHSLDEYGFSFMVFQNPGYFEKDFSYKAEYGTLKFTKMIKSGIRNYIDKNNNKKGDSNEIGQNKNLVMILESKVKKQKSEDSEEKEKLDSSSKSNTEKSSIKVVLISDSHIFQDPFTANYTGNRIFINSIFRWLTEDVSILGIVPKMGTVTPVSLTSRKRNLMYYVGLIILPLLIMSGGFIYTRYQSNKFK